MPDEASVLRLASQLAGKPARAAARIGGGGNNQLYRVAFDDATCALKCYPSTPGDPHDRLAVEFGALRFLAAAGIDAAPRALAADPAERCALYEWIAGEPVGSRDPDASAAMLAFLRRLHAARTSAGAEALPRAAEAVANWSELAEQVERRFARLGAAAATEPALGAFLSGEARPLWERLAATAGGVVAGPPTLSPSDFGTHNMLRRPDGRMAFVDFEYFGWDDPVKLACDVLWHPAMELDAAAAGQFRAGVADIYRDDASFRERLHVRLPAFGLRWALIVLNEFLPDHWERRRLAGASPDWAAVKARQLARARSLVRRAEAVRAGAPWPG